MKTADLRAHNASRCEALWACRSAVFTIFEFTKCNISGTEVLQFQMHLMVGGPQFKCDYLKRLRTTALGQAIEGLPRFGLRHQWVNPLIPGATYTLFYLWWLRALRVSSAIPVHVATEQGISRQCLKIEEITAPNALNKIIYKNWWNIGQIVK